MKFDKTIQDFLKGNQFSNGIKVEVSQSETTILSCLEILDKLLKKQKVVHLGCCDHIPIIEGKRKNNLWIHSRITETTDKYFGVDINEEGINYLKSKLKYKDLVCADIQKDEIPEINNDSWDYILLGEILEHIDNPVKFLSSIRERYFGTINKMIVSVPNAFRDNNFINNKNHVEIINSDHRFWFTPYTLAKVFTSA